MSEKEIKDLAREYIEYRYRNYHAENRDRVIEQDTNELYHIFKWLSSRYCLVKKSEAEKLARLIFENGSSEDFGLIDGLVDWVEDNFTEEYHKVLENGSKCR